MEGTSGSTSLAATAISIVDPAVSAKRKDSASDMDIANKAESIANGAPASAQTAEAKTSAPTDGSSTTTTTTTRAAERVRLVQLHEYKEAAACLAEAFADDDVARYFVDTPDSEGWSKERKWALHVEILEYITYAHILKGRVTTVGEGFGGVALWMPPGANADSLLTLLRSGLWRLYYRLPAEGRHRFFTEFLPLLHDTKHAVLGARDPLSWYLVYIGTKPSARGKGYGRRLVEEVSEVADREGRPVYLESSNERNVVLYRRFGFEGVRRMFLQRGREVVGLEIMVREPRGKEEVCE